MKRLIFLAIAVLALAIPAVATAKSHDHTLSLTANPSSVVTGDLLTLSGSLLDEHNRGIGNAKVTISVYAGSIAMPTHIVWTSNSRGTAKGTYRMTSTNMLEPGTYTLKATARGATSETVSLIVTDKVVPVVPVVPAVPMVAPADAGAFLCYSLYQTNPGVWPVTEASDLFASGYWQPFAVLGTVTDGTNLGAYHLTCNLATGQSVAEVHGYAGAGGEVYGPDLHTAFDSVLGMYPIVG